MERKTKQRAGMACIFALYVALVGAIWWELEILNQAVIEEQVLESAINYTDFLEHFRSIYTSEVINRLPLDKVTVTHDYHERLHAIPLPATMTIMLSHSATEEKPGFEVSLVSSYPFPWRQDRVLDSFTEQALKKIEKTPGQPVVTTEYINGEAFLRYARADLMRQACVDCHNSHPKTPKNNWRVNDVRGILSVKIPMTQTYDASQQVLRDLMLIVLLIATLMVSVNTYLLFDSLDLDNPEK